VGICAVLGFGPLAFGAVQPWSIFVLEVGTAFLMIVWATREVANGRFHVVPNQLYIPMALFAIVVLIQVSFHLTAYWYETWSKGLLWASYAGLFFLVSQAFHREPWISGFGFFCAGYGFLLSLFAVVQQFTSNGKIYWVVPNRYGGWIYGPYVNHAHYAGLMEMLVPFPLVFAIAGSAGRPIRAFFLFAAVVMSSTIFLSQSLGGMIAFAAQLGVLSLILLRNRRSSYREIMLVGVLCSALIAWLVWLRPLGLVERLARLLNPISDAGATGRVAIVRDSLKMVWQRPILGWGLGTFPIAYPSFRSFFTNLWVNEAHNDYVQTLVETGIVGFACAAAFLFLLCRAGLRNSRCWRRERESRVALAAFIGCLGLLVHGVVDFNLQIPANAAFFFALSSLATTRSNTSKANQASDRMRG
jgi:O-antigen ligase